MNQTVMRINSNFVLPLSRGRISDVEQTFIDSNRRREYGYTALQHFATLVKIAALFTIIFMPAYGFHHCHIPPGKAIVPVETGILVGSIGVGLYAHDRAKWAEFRKKCHQTFADSIIYDATGVVPKNEISTFNKMMNRVDHYISGTFRECLQFIKTGSDIEYPSANCGKWEDIWRHDQATNNPQLTVIAAQSGIRCTPMFKTEPYGKGVCLGACLIFAKEYLTNGQNWQAAAKQFAGGAPHEAVALQEQYMHMKRSVFYTWAGENADFLNSSTGLDFRAGRAAAMMVALDVIENHTGTKREAIAALVAKPDGVYQITHDLSDGRHAVLLIKKGDECIFFDPNYETYSFGKEKLQSVLEKELSSKGTIDICQIIS